MESIRKLRTSHSDFAVSTPVVVCPCVDCALKRKLVLETMNQPGSHQDSISYIPLSHLGCFQETRSSGDKSSKFAVVVQHIRGKSNQCDGIYCPIEKCSCQFYKCIGYKSEFKEHLVVEHLFQIIFWFEDSTDIIALENIPSINYQPKNEGCGWKSQLCFVRFVLFTVYCKTLRILRNTSNWNEFIGGTSKIIGNDQFTGHFQQRYQILVLRPIQEIGLINFINSEKEEYSEFLLFVQSEFDKKNTKSIF